MNIKKWIEAHQNNVVLGHVQVIDVAALRALLKTHAIVPREPTRDMAIAGGDALASSPDDDIYLHRGRSVDAYTTMISASEVGNE